MKIPKNVNVVNDSYRTLSERAIMLRNTLEKLGYNVEWGYYDRHTVTVNGDNFLEYYPIPVLTVNGILPLTFCKCRSTASFSPPSLKKSSILQSLNHTGLNATVLRTILKACMFPE